MSPEEILKYLEERVDSLQRKIAELSEQKEEIERLIKKYRELMRYYRGVYEAEAGVGIQGEVIPDVVESLEAIAEPDLDELLEEIRGRGRNISWAISQVLSNSDPLRVEEICERIAQHYPEIAKKPKNLFHSVEMACQRAFRDGILERVAPRRYGIIKREENEHST